MTTGKDAGQSQSAVSIQVKGKLSGRKILEWMVKVINKTQTPAGVSFKRTQMSTEHVQLSIIYKSNQFLSTKRLYMIVKTWCHATGELKKKQDKIRQ